jgi:N-acetyl sugar amidotransferase
VSYGGGMTLAYPDPIAVPRALYGLPATVRFCQRCLMSNQRPSSFPEHRHTPARRVQTLHIDEHGVCDACRYADWKRSQAVDWAQRETELAALCDKHRSTDGSHDCIVPGSGGKDSMHAAWVLRERFGMHPLTVTWPPILRTEIGKRNFATYTRLFDNVEAKPPQHATLTRLAIENLLHPFQSFILGQKNFAPKMAAKYKIPLVFYGENEAEYGNPIGDNATSLRNADFYSAGTLADTFLAGVSMWDLMTQHGVSGSDALYYLPMEQSDIPPGLEVHYLGYYLPWCPQEVYYSAVEHCGFQANPTRTEGTYSKYNSLDDKIDGLHYYTTYIKFGLGRATYDASQEIRNRHISRDEGLALVRRFDGEFPAKDFNEVMAFLDMKPAAFRDLCEAGKSPHLWDGEVLRHVPWEEGAL